MNGLPATKKCSHCKKNLPLENFSKKSSLKDGLNSNCRQCSSILYSEYVKRLRKRKNTKKPKTKKCPRCGLIKKSKDFPAHDGRVDGLQPYCKSCYSDMSLFIKYKMSREEWNAIFRKQNNSCAICHSSADNKERWAVDHDHQTGKIRGILCTKCNQGLGCFKDNPKFLESAVDYLNNDGLSSIN